MVLRGMSGLEHTRTRRGGRKIGKPTRKKASTCETSVLLVAFPPGDRHWRDLFFCALSEATWHLWKTLQPTAGLDEQSQSLGTELLFTNSLREKHTPPRGSPSGFQLRLPFYRHIDQLGLRSPLGHAALYMASCAMPPFARLDNRHPMLSLGIGYISQTTIECVDRFIVSSDSLSLMLNLCTSP